MQVNFLPAMFCFHLFIVSVIEWHFVFDFVLLVKHSCLLKSEKWRPVLNVCSHPSQGLWTTISTNQEFNANLFQSQRTWIRLFLYAFQCSVHFSQHSPYFGLNWCNFCCNKQTFEDDEWDTVCLIPIVNKGSKVNRSIWVNVSCTNSAVESLRPLPTPHPTPAPPLPPPAPSCPYMVVTSAWLSLCCISM